MGGQADFLIRLYSEIVLYCVASRLHRNGNGKYQIQSQVFRENGVGEIK